jgi:hypothetical protein
MGAGSAAIVCNDGTQATVELITEQGHTFHYSHLDAASVAAAGITDTGVAVSHGADLGRILDDTNGWSEECGNGSGPHLHFEIETSALPVVIDGYTFSMSQQHTGEQLTSSNGSSALLAASTGEQGLLFFGEDSYDAYAVTSDGHLDEVIATSSGASGWDVISAIDVDGDGQDELLFYNDNGTFAYRDINAEGQLGEVIQSGTYTAGWSAITAITAIEHRRMVRHHRCSTRHPLSDHVSSTWALQRPARFCGGRSPAAEPLRHEVLAVTVRAAILTDPGARRRARAGHDVGHESRGFCPRQDRQEAHEHKTTGRRHRRQQGHRAVRGRGRDEAALAETAALAGGDIHTLECDVADPESIAAAFAAVGPVDVLVNNAGIADSAPIPRIDLASWERMHRVNATGPLLCIQQVLPGMRERDWGRIVTVRHTRRPSMRYSV